MSGHEHAWELVIHVDSCHAWTSQYRCKCGATRVTSAERDVKSDPYSTVWMTDGNERCDRCHELLDGATPKHSDEIVLPK